LKDNGVSLGTINAKVPQSEIARVKKIQQQIIAGKINIPTTVK
jgi:basic membrane lipoprotein Med (substrate-binding protein (PBP1-ABC) superfamily)